VNHLAENLVEIFHWWTITKFYHRTILENG